MIRGWKACHIGTDFSDNDLRYDLINAGYLIQLVHQIGLVKRDHQLINLRFQFGQLGVQVVNMFQVQAQQQTVAVRYPGTMNQRRILNRFHLRL